jgi:endonuclease/exonuclease/phosphatase family metal-dependent hydrolase
MAIPADELLRIGTLNANHAPEAARERTQLVIDEQNRLGHDVLCLQEVRFGYDGASCHLDDIVRGTGLELVTALAQAEVTEGMTGNAILSSLPVLESGHLPLGTPDAKIPHASYAVLTTPSGQALIVVSAHLHWGGDQERQRLIQATTIDYRVRSLLARYEHQNPMAVLAGDLNTDPDSDTIRFLRGKGAGATHGYTYWTDAFTAGDPAEAVTVANDNPWAIETAKLKNIRLPHLLPNRRIDYIWTYGWAYGKPGGAVSLTRTFTDTSRYGYPASDHYGLTADFWTPPLAAVPGWSDDEVRRLLDQAPAVEADATT